MIARDHPKQDARGIDLGKPPDAHRRSQPAPDVYFLAVNVGDRCFSCFRVYRIPRVERAAYVVLDRHRLKYLNWIEAVVIRRLHRPNGRAPKQDHRLLQI